MEGILAIVMSMAIPIVIAICLTVTSITNKRSETELRKTIAEANNIDPETAKVLVAHQPRHNRKWRFSTTNLTGGLSLIGLGLGMIIACLMNFGTGQLEFWISLAFGTGLGLLASFLITWKLSSKMEQKEKAEETEDNNPD